MKAPPISKSTLANLGELEIIRRIQRLARAEDESVILGIGDDAAVVRLDGENSELVLTTDSVVEGVHFTSEAPPAAVGHKLAGRLLSDLAAMGAEPLWMLCNIAAPARYPADAVTSLYRGMKKLASRHGMSIIGGDMTRAEKLHLHGFAIGRLPRGSAVTRAGARPGDIIFVTGTLGGSISGKHLRFSPRVDEALWLREGGWPSAMIDISDGLLRDLSHISAASNCAAELDAKLIPISRAARKLDDGHSPLEHALSDGEDFELLFTIPPGKASLFLPSWRSTFRLKCTRIGRMVPGSPRIDLISGQKVLRHPCPSGYEHFKRSKK